MTGFDLCVLAILAISLLLGLWRGLVSEVLALAAWVLALLAGKTFSSDAAPALAGVIKDPTLQMSVAFALIVVAVILLVALVRFLLRELLRAAGLGVADRLLGACFGLGRGLLVVLLGVLLRFDIAAAIDLVAGIDAGSAAGNGGTGGQTVDAGGDGQTNQVSVKVKHVRNNRRRRDHAC